MIDQYITQTRNTTVKPLILDDKTQWTDGWFKIRKLDIDMVALKQECLAVQQFIKKRYEGEHLNNYYKNQTTNLFEKYNLFLFSSFTLHQLFGEIVDLWNQVKPKDSKEKYYLQSWLNVYDNSKSIGWHYHWTEKYFAWHGFVCVDVDVSKTTYALQSPHYQESKAVDYGTFNDQPLLQYNDEYELIDVVGQDGLVVLSRSAGDSHRNVPWQINDRPRITIGFDIVPGRHIFNEDWENHWIPLV